MPLDAWFAALLPARGAVPIIDGTMVLASTVGLGVLAVMAPLRVLHAERRVGAAFAITLVVGLALTLGLQLLVGRPRPEVTDALLAVPGVPSFPSGHAVLVAIAGVFVGRSGGRALVGATALALLVAVSRVHVGHHHITDVVGGLALGAGLGLGGLTAVRASPDDPWRLRWLVWPQVGLVTAISVVAYTGSLAAADPGWLRIAGMDKVLHFVLFGLLAFGTHYATRGRAWRLRLPGARPLAVPLAVLVPLGVAAADEAVQALSPHRSADPLDLLADLAGLVCFRWVAHRLQECRAPTSTVPTAAGR